MQKSKKIIALFAAIMMLVAMLSCTSFASAAKTISILPEGYVVVNADWEGMGYLETFEYELGGETYKLEYGQTAACSINQAQNLPIASGVQRTIVLAPGLYSSSITVSTNMRFCGPFFGKNPNNNPNLDDYDSNMPAWSIANGRSLDSEKEAVFTGSLIIGNGVDNITFDGLAFTGAGRITDSSQTDAPKVVEYHFENLYFKDVSSGSIIDVSAKTMINRYVYVDKIRVDTMPAAGNDVIKHQANELVVDNSYFYELNSSMTGSNVSFYTKAAPFNNYLGHYMSVRSVFRNNHFEKTGGNNLFNFAAISAQTANIRNYDRVELTVINNDLIDCALGNGKIVQDQIEGDNQVLTFVGNRVIRTDKNYSKTNLTAVGNYRTDTGPKSYAKLHIEKNYFNGYGYRPVNSSYDEIPMNNVGLNYIDCGAGQSEAPSDNANRVSYVAGTVYDSSAKYVSTDFDMLNSSFGAVSFSGTSGVRTATVNLVNGAVGVPTFTFKGDEVKYDVYADDALTTPIASDFEPYYGDTIYVKATEGSYSCTYAVNFSSSKSKKTDLFKYGDGEILNYNPDMKRVIIDFGKSEDGYFVFPTGNDVEVATGATLEVYTNPECEGNAVSKVALQSRRTLAYLKITAPSGATDKYTLILCGELPEKMAADGSEECNLLKFTADKTTVIGDETTGFIVEAPDGATSIKPHLLVSNLATYKFYMDADCKYEAPTVNTVKLYSNVNTFFVQVTSENGTKSAAIPVYVFSNRKAVTYTDMASTPSYAKKAVKFLNEGGYGLFAGDEKGRLNPNKNITRYELAKVMVTLAGINVDMSESVKLGDIYDDFYQIQKEASWAIPYIRTAYASGLINGISDGKGNVNFAGNSYTTREQFTTVFVRAYAFALNMTENQLYKAYAKDADAAFNHKFADQKQISSWAVKSVKLATYFGFVNGDGKNFKPKDNITRAQVAVIAYNAEV